MWMQLSELKSGDDCPAKDCSGTLFVRDSNAADDGWRVQWLRCRKCRRTYRAINPRENIRRKKML
jgi:hypothetical protein